MRKLFILIGLLFFSIAYSQNNDPEGSSKIKFIQKKYEKGIDFYAIGNEPFWSLNLDFEKVFHFKNLDGLDIEFPAIKGDLQKDSITVQFRSDTESYKIIIELTQKECSDTMADEKFKYQVNVRYKSSKDADFKTVEGCGNYIPDFRLHNIWAVDQVGDTDILAKDFTKGQPVIEINANKYSVLGHDGCNNFTGAIDFEYGFVIFKNLAGTLMACPNMEISHKITKAISNRKLSYQFKDRKLYLKEKEKIIMVLHHVD